MNHKKLLRHHASAGTVRSLLALLTTLLLLTSLTACAPRGHAVGDTQDTTPTIAHDHIDHSDYGVGVIGSGTDDELVQRFRKGTENAILAVMYAQASTGETQRNAVEDFTQRKLTFIVVHPDDPDNPDTQKAWEKSLNVARDAGVPVILLDGHITPDNQLLYAANFIPDDREPGEDGVYSITDALATVIDAQPHDKTMRVHY